MTPKHTTEGTLDVDRGRSRSVGGAGGEEGAPPTPRGGAGARVPRINDVREHPPRFPRLQAALAAHDTPEFHEARGAQIGSLLHHYRDVLEGIPDREHRGSDDLLALMCPAWNHRSYQQLERLLRELKRERPVLHAKLVTRFLRYSERRVAWCKKCGNHPAEDVGKVHAHPPGRSIALKAKLVRVLPRNDDPAGVEEAISWLEERWSGRADLPRAVFEIEAERKLRAA